MIVIDPKDAQPTQDPARAAALDAVGASPANYILIIDRDLCIGAATCVDIAPKTFALDDENKAILLVEPWTDDGETILAAAKSCPTLAITVKDRATGEVVFPA